MSLTAPPNATAPSVFARVLVAVDGSEAACEAARQAARLVAPDGELELVTAVFAIEASLQGWTDERLREALEREGGAAIRAAAELVGARAATRLVHGPPKQTILGEAERYDASLVALGSHDHGRLSELIVGGVSGPVLHEARCSVLIARRARTAALFPLRISVGVDGSATSFAALGVARELGNRYAVPVRAILARGGDVDIVHAELHAPELEIVDGSPVDALVDAAHGSDLVVVGSRGLRGWRSLGSVSERVAHRASSSVLVVRSENGGSHGKPDLAGRLARRRHA